MSNNPELQASVNLDMAWKVSEMIIALDADYMSNLRHGLQPCDYHYRTYFPGQVAEMYGVSLENANKVIAVADDFVDNHYAVENYCSTMERDSAPPSKFKSFLRGLRAKRLEDQKPTFSA
jgi:hypothetical protein